MVWSRIWSSLWMPNALKSAGIGCCCTTTQVPTSQGSSLTCWMQKEWKLCPILDTVRIWAHRIFGCSTSWRGWPMEWSTTMWMTSKLLWMLQWLTFPRQNSPTPWMIPTLNACANALHPEGHISSRRSSWHWLSVVQNRSLDSQDFILKLWH